MTDEKFVFVSDVREKKNVARSARNMRTHNGKGGKVKFPSDYLSKKELVAMSGEVKSYKLNSPMTWREFKTMPDDLKVTYIKALRTKYAVPDNEISEMFGVDRQTVGRWFRCLGLGLGKCAGSKAKNAFDKESWIAWCNGVSVPVTPVEAEVEEPTTKGEEISVEICDREPVVPESIPPVKTLPVCEKKATAVPCSGNMTFECPANQALDMIAKVLGRANVLLTVKWDVLPDEGSES